MTIARVVAGESKDPSSRVGCVILDEDSRVVSAGYNGFVAGCDEGQMTQSKPMKYELVIHSEMNAILHARRSLKGCVLYSTHAPCNNCLKHILQAGIREIYYEDNSIMKRTSKLSNDAVVRLISATGAEVRNLVTNLPYESEIETHQRNAGEIE